MTERPIIFTGESVRAILAGKKSQTRRLVTDATSQGNYRASELLLNDPRVFVDRGPSPAGNPGPYLHAPVNALLVEHHRGWRRGDCDETIMERLYPRWFPGDRLWVREPWGYRGSTWRGGDKHEMQRIEYRADGAKRSFSRPLNDRGGLPAQVCRCKGKGSAQPDGPTDEHHEELYRYWHSWRSPIHMPRWASRLTLEVTEVRAQRLQEISEDDAIAEGIERQELPLDPDNFHPPGSYGYIASAAPEALIYVTPRDAFAVAWDSINGKRAPRESNPWCWAISFKRADGAR